MASDAKENDTPVGFIAQLLYNKVNDSQITAGGISTWDNMMLILKMWGSDYQIEGMEDFKVKPEIRFTIPEEVLKYFNFKSDVKSSNVADLIKIYHGCLNHLDTDLYNDSYDDFKDSYGLIDPADIVGEHNIWSILNSLSNSIINEVTCDLRWEDDKPVLALYKRIKPFIIDKDRMLADKNFVGDNGGATVNGLDKYFSEFKNIRRIEIPLHEILSFDAGTNWGDRINFIEVKPNDPYYSDNISTLVRFESQFYDKKSFTREGLRSFIVPCRFYPAELIDLVSESVNDTNDIKKASDKEDEITEGIKRDGNEDKNNSKVDSLANLVQWKYLLKEWYFDAHRMLNGMIGFMVQDKYIQVGDNIMVDATITGYTKNMTSDQVNSKQDLYLLAHVEAVSHSFSVDQNGGRHFMTSIGFVRGIIVDKDGTPVAGSRDFGQIDQNTENVTLLQELNSNVITNKTYMDVN